MGQRKGGAGRGETGVLRDEREWSVVPLLQGQQGFAPPGIKKPLSNVFCSAAFVLGKVLQQVCRRNGRNLATREVFLVAGDDVVCTDP